MPKISKSKMKKIEKRADKFFFYYKVAILILSFIFFGNIIAWGPGITNQVSKIFYWPGDTGLVAGDFIVSMTQSGNGNLIVKADNPSWLEYSNGSPFFLCGAGNPEDFLYRGNRKADGTRNGDQVALINQMKSTGANGIYADSVLGWAWWRRW